MPVIDILDFEAQLCTIRLDNICVTLMWSMQFNLDTIWSEDRNKVISVYFGLKPESLRIELLDLLVSFTTSITLFSTGSVGNEVGDDKISNLSCLWERD